MGPFAALFVNGLRIPETAEISAVLFIISSAFEMNDYCIVLLTCLIVPDQTA